MSGIAAGISYSTVDVMIHARVDYAARTNRTATRVRSSACSASPSRSKESPGSG
jgi:hypothetical protein